MSNFNDYIKDYEDLIEEYSDQAYSNDISSSAVLYGFDRNEIIDEVCFARLYSHFAKYKTSSANYLLRLPNRCDDKNNELHKYFIDYPVFFNNLRKLVEDTHEITIHNTNRPNTKLIVIENKMNIPKNLDYCITLLLYVLIRGVEGEYISLILAEKPKLSGDMKEYLRWVSEVKRGSHHNISDSLDRIINLKNSHTEKLKTLAINTFVNIITEVFGKDGLIHHPNFIPYFTEIFKLKPNGYGYPMQTSCFDYIQRVYNRIKLEES